MVSSSAIVLDTHFLAQVEDAARWEERFDLLVNELCEEYGPYFQWRDSLNAEIDIVFILYPPGQHERMVKDLLLENYVSTNTGRVAHVHVIVIGRNPKNAKILASDVGDIVNVQCTPSGPKAASSRVLRPEGIDETVRDTLVRLHTRRQLGTLRLEGDLSLSENSDVTIPRLVRRPIYESEDL